MVIFRPEAVSTACPSRRSHSPTGPADCYGRWETVRRLIASAPASIGSGRRRSCGPRPGMHAPRSRSTAAPISSRASPAITRQLLASSGQGWRGSSGGSAGPPISFSRCRAISSDSSSTPSVFARSGPSSWGMVSMRRFSPPVPRRYPLLGRASTTPIGSSWWAASTAGTAPPASWRALTPSRRAFLTSGSTSSVHWMTLGASRPATAVPISVVLAFGHPTNLL